MRYVMTRLQEYQREVMYRIYVTDSLKVLTGSEERYWCLIDTTPPDTRTKEDIIKSIWSKIGVKQ